MRPFSHQQHESIGYGFHARVQMAEGFAVGFDVERVARAVARAAVCGLGLYQLDFAGESVAAGEGGE
ncbi:MAG TPA: hypothetical protein VHX20_14970 [Terracidiphilus sp.]|nr:hypothetical protein [Terracidiphilus sp.]